MAEAVNCQTLKAEAHFHSQAISVGILVSMVEQG